MKPNSNACERNKEPILQALKTVITRADRRLLEVGSGTGQPAEFMAPDLGERLPDLKMWQRDHGFEVMDDVKMPANKHLLIFNRLNFIG
jgi:hypothetical protein